MVINVGCRDESVRLGAMSLAREESKHLAKYFRQIFQVDWHINHQRHQNVVTCTVHTPTGQLHAEARADTIAHAILEASRMIEAQRRRAKRREIADRHSGAFDAVEVSGTR
jgi:ribosomal subunit interface protein